MEKKLSIKLRKVNITDGISIGKTGTKSGKYYKSYKQQLAHDTRVEVMQDKYIKNPEKFKLNKMKIWNKDPDKLLEAAKADFKKYRKYDLPNNTKPIVVGLLSFSEKFHLNEEADRQLLHDTVNLFLENKYGSEILLYNNQQNDETALHFSFTLLNYDFTNHKTLLQPMTVGDFSNLQDEIADHLKSHNADFGHIRGTKGTYKEQVGIMQGKLNEAENQLEEKDDQLVELLKEVQELKEEKSILTKEVDQLNSVKALELSDMTINLIDEYEGDTNVLDSIKSKLEDLKDFINNKENITEKQAQSKLNRANALSSKASKVITTMAADGSIRTKRSNSPIQQLSQKQYKKLQPKDEQQMTSDLRDIIVGLKTERYDDPEWKDYNGEVFQKLFGQYVPKRYYSEEDRNIIFEAARQAANLDIHMDFRSEIRIKNT